MSDSDRHISEPEELGWWSISGERLMALLHRAHRGEKPEMIYAEEYANSEHEYVEGDDA